MAYIKDMGKLTSSSTLSIPDYTTYTDITSTFNQEKRWEATSSGWVSIYVYVTTIAGGTHSIMVNGTTVATSAGAGGSDDCDAGTTLFPVKKGDVITMTTRNNNVDANRVLFFPTT